MLKFNCSKSQKKKEKKRGIVVASQLMQKLSASPKSQYSPRCCTVQMAGVSAYQSECYHGGREKKKLQLYMYMLFVLCWVTVCDCCYFPPPTYFPTKTTRGQVRVTPRSGKLAPWESPKHGTITTGSVAGPSVDHGSTCLFGILASCNTTSVLSSTSEAWFVNKTLKKKKKPPGSHYVWPNIFLSSISHPNKTAATVFKLNVRQPYYPTSSLYAKLSMTLVLVNVWPGTQYQRSTAWTPLRRYLLQMTSLTQDGSACIQYILALSSYSVKKWRRVFLLLMCRCTGTRRCEVHWKSFLGNKCIFWC